MKGKKTSVSSTVVPKLSPVIPPNFLSNSRFKYHTKRIVNKKEKGIRMNFLTVKYKIKAIGKTEEKMSSLLVILPSNIAPSPVFLAGLL